MPTDPDYTSNEPQMRIVEERVIQKIRNRGDIGFKKYGVTLDRHDLSLAQWFTHRQEEAMDALQYDEVLTGKLDVISQAIRMALEAHSEGNAEIVQSALELIDEAVNGKTDPRSTNPEINTPHY